MAGYDDGWSEAKILMAVGMVMLVGATLCLMVSGGLTAIMEDPAGAVAAGEDPEQVIEEINDRTRMAGRLTAIGGPLAAAGAALLVASVILPAARPEDAPRRLLAFAVLLAAAAFAVLGGLVADEVLWDDGFSDTYRAWKWVNVAGWAGLALGTWMVAAALRGEASARVVAGVEPNEPARVSVDDPDA